MVLLLGSCSSHSNGTASTDGEVVSADDFPTAYANAACDAFANCCATAAPPFDRAACVTEMLREGQALVRNTSASRVYDPHGAAKCVDATRMLFSECVLPAKDKFDEACRPMWIGTAAVGSACQSDKDCASSDQGPVRCELVSPTTPPTVLCVVDPPGQMGEPCLGSNGFDPNVHQHLTCADGFWCDTTGHCAQAFSQGVACTASPQCAPTLWCDPGPMGMNNTCAPQAQLGEPCGGLNAQCASGTCSQGMCALGEPITCSMGGDAGP